MVVKDRNSIRASIEALGYLESPILNDYRINRNSEVWRLSRAVEELCEYILYLVEEKQNGQMD